MVMRKGAASWWFHPYFLVAAPFQICLEVAGVFNRELRSWRRVCLSGTAGVGGYRSRFSSAWQHSPFCFQGLFHRVLREEISLSKLVRMKPEELLSKELSVWKEKPAKAVSNVISPSVLRNSEQVCQPLPPILGNALFSSQWNTFSLSPAKWYQSTE